MQLIKSIRKVIFVSLIRKQSTRRCQICIEHSTRQKSAGDRDE